MRILAQLQSTTNPNHEETMKRPVFFLDADDDLGNRAVGMAANRPQAEANLLAEVQGALGRLQSGDDGDRVTLILTRTDMTSDELAALPEE